MTKILVWPDATYLDASEYNEVEFNYKGEDLITIDLQDIADGKDAVVSLEFYEVVGRYRFSELLQAEHQLKATSTMFRNYRNTMREHLARLHADQSHLITKLSAEQAAILSSKEQEIKTILQARDQWVKELQGKLREATRLLNESEEVNTELENRIAVLSAQPPSPAFQGDLAEENRRLKSQLAGATARIGKQIDGYDAQAKLAEWKGRAETAETKLAEWKGRAETAETKLAEWEGRYNASVADLQFQVAEAKAEVAKLKSASAIPSDIEDNLRKERDGYAVLLAKHGVCTDCGDMFEHHEDEPFASCSCQTSEWPEAPLSPYMLLQRRIKQLEDSNAEDESFAVQELKGEIAEMKRITASAIATLQEIE